MQYLENRGIYMDKIIINNFELFGNHGVFKEEKLLGQKFILSIELSLDLSSAGKTDNLTSTVHYGELMAEIEELFQRTSYDLIEKAAEEVSTYILKSYNIVKSVSVELKKPFAPTGKHVDYVSVKLIRQWSTAYISMGSNIGNKEEYIKKAKELINKNPYCKITKEANMYITEPVGYEDQDDFLNTAIEVRTILNINELMDVLLEIEMELKRERLIKWGPRTIDLDIIFFEDMITSSGNAIVPHPRMQERLFVLEPLCDIIPNMIHPLLKKRIIDMKEHILNIGL
jgi:dihydroneopterin aldolase/2-amino-4-hydroxy-6-hydroxymethyldihydropteridine diphosphokinase